MLTKNSNNKVKRKINEKINLYSPGIGCSFKKFLTIDEEISDLLKKV